MSHEGEKSTIADSFQVAGDVMIHAFTGTVRAINPFKRSASQEAVCREEPRHPTNYPPVTYAH